jgi:hypothetical protein
MFAGLIIAWYQQGFAPTGKLLTQPYIIITKCSEYY